MARSREAEAEVEEKEEGTLYDEIAEISGIEYDPDEHKSPAEYKQALAAHFDDYEDDDFDKLPKPVIAYLNDLTETIKKNKGARKKSALPPLEGLEGDEPPKETETKSGRKRGAAKEKKEKKASEPRDNRYLKAFRVLLKDPKATREDLVKKCDFAENAAAYCSQAFSAAKQAFEEAGWKAP